jgi:uncharacterized cupin superfamily protein
MSLRDRLIRNFNEAELKPATRAPLYDGARSGGVIGPDIDGVAARKLGCGYDETPPGKRSCPYHFHYAQEEMFIILEGNATLRVAGEEIPIKAGDVICIPPGPDYPHHIINTGVTTLKYLSVSTQEDPELCEYPDSRKYLAYSRVKGPLLEGGRMHRAETDLDYWDGEP